MDIELRWSSTFELLMIFWSHTATFTNVFTGVSFIYWGLESTAIGFQVRGSVMHLEGNSCLRVWRACGLG